jgi:hypothetical protein
MSVTTVTKNETTALLAIAYLNIAAVSETPNTSGVNMSLYFCNVGRFGIQQGGTAVSSDVSVMLEITSQAYGSSITARRSRPAMKIKIDLNIVLRLCFIGYPPSKLCHPVSEV